MIVFQIGSSGLALDEELQLPFELDGQVAEGALDGELGGDFGVLVEPQNVGHEVADDDARIALVHIARLCRFEGLLIPPERWFRSVHKAFGDAHTT